MNTILPTDGTNGAPDDGQDELLEWLIDEALLESFPASDPPCWTLGREPSARSATTRQLEEEGDDPAEIGSET